MTIGETRINGKFKIGATYSRNGSTTVKNGKR